MTINRYYILFCVTHIGARSRMLHTRAEPPILWTPTQLPFVRSFLPIRPLGSASHARHPLPFAAPTLPAPLAFQERRRMLHHFVARLDPRFAKSQLSRVNLWIYPAPNLSNAHTGVRPCARHPKDNAPFEKTTPPPEGSSGVST
jgi:hypothetical protein